MPLARSMLKSRTSVRPSHPPTLAARRQHHHHRLVIIIPPVGWMGVRRVLQQQHPRPENACWKHIFRIVPVQSLVVDEGESTQEWVHSINSFPVGHMPTPVPFWATKHLQPYACQPVYVGRLLPQKNANCQFQVHTLCAQVKAPGRM